MKNYSPRVAAERIVRSHVQHGLSRYKFPDIARTVVTGVLTEKAHVSALTQYARALKATKGKHLKNSSPEDAMVYLQARAKDKSQSTVDLDRQAINFHLHSENPVPFTPSEIETQPSDRAYTHRQIEMLVKYAEPDLALSIAVAADAGLRGMEILTIGQLSDMHLSEREWSPDRFLGRESDARFVVRGKGGLCREVRLQTGLAEQVVARSLPTPQRVVHRGAHLVSHISMLGGHQFAVDFTKLSQRLLGFSNGAHGLRHSFAQKRRDELMCCGLSYERAILALSQELGHFSVANTLAYLRDRQTAKN